MRTPSAAPCSQGRIRSAHPLRRRVPCEKPRLARPANSAPFGGAGPRCAARLRVRVEEMWSGRGAGDEPQGRSPRPVWGRSVLDFSGRRRGTAEARGVATERSDVRQRFLSSWWLWRGLSARPLSAIFFSRRAVRLLALVLTSSRTSFYGGLSRGRHTTLSPRLCHGLRSSALLVVTR